MKYVSALAISTCLLLNSAGGVLAASAINPNRPSHACGTATGPGSPGNAASSPGAPFNESSPGQADTVYAGATGSHSAANAQSPNAFSNYDVACSQVPN
jgi:hypothetical protein